MSITAQRCRRVGRNDGRWWNELITCAAILFKRRAAQLSKDLLEKKSISNRGPSSKRFQSRLCHVVCSQECRESLVAAMPSYLRRPANALAAAIDQCHASALQPSESAGLTRLRRLHLCHCSCRLRRSLHQLHHRSHQSPG
eukprot:322889-Chlamydomonas_euryale.AAC.1